MTTSGLAFCIGLPILFGTVALVTHFMQCHTQRVQRTHFSVPRDYERYHYARLPDFLDMPVGKPWPTTPELGDSNDHHR